MLREVRREDIEKLLEIKAKRFAKFQSKEAEEQLKALADKLKTNKYNIEHLVDYTISWFEHLKEKYGNKYPRRTEVRNFASINLKTVVEANQKLYINREEGFIGTGMKKDEYVQNCSDIDDIIIFYKDGTYKVVRIADKLFVGETERSKAEKRKAEIIHVAVFKKNDSRTVYNAIYRDGKSGAYYIKRFNVTSMTRDREYDLTQGKLGSRVVYFTPNPNGEAEVVKVTLKPNPKLKRVFFDKDFSEIAIKGRQSMGNLVTKLDVANIRLSRHGGSTLGGRKVWFDPDVKRLNYDGQGNYLGEFNSDEQILVIRKNGEFYATNFDPNNHYEDDILRIEKYDPKKVWTACLFDADQQGFAYMKRFTLEATARHQSYLGENPESQLILLTDTPFPHLLVTMGGNDDFREPLDIEADEFIGVKSFKAKGKRITTCNVAKIEELEPTKQPEVPEIPEVSEAPNEPNEPDYQDNHEESQDEVLDQMNGQLRLFDN